MPTTTPALPAELAERIRDMTCFVRATFSRPLRAMPQSWVKVVVRPVQLRAGRVWQFSYFDAKRDITKNFTREELERPLAELLALPFGEINLLTTTERLHVKCNRRGEPRLQRTPLAQPRTAPELAHDRVRRQPLPAGTADQFLQAIGILDAEGRPRPAMRAKHHQINEFLKVLAALLPELGPADAPLEVVDCGCGRAYLTFAAYHFLAGVQGRAVRVVGLDVNGEQIAAAQQLSATLGWSGLEFRHGRIAAYQPAQAPDLVLSLHACDTATDEALALGLRWGARAILAAPCCQHELHDQVQNPVFQPVLKHGILRGRLADILTDAFRAQLLAQHGYRTDIIEFIDAESTAKNLLIRALRHDGPRPAQLAEAYAQLKAFWQVSPALERMLSGV